MKSRVSRCDWDRHHLNFIIAPVDFLLLFFLRFFILFYFLFCCHFSVEEHVKHISDSSVVRTVRVCTSTLYVHSFGMCIVGPHFTALCALLRTLAHTNTLTSFNRFYFSCEQQNVSLMFGESVSFINYEDHLFTLSSTTITKTTAANIDCQPKESRKSLLIDVST